MPKSYGDLLREARASIKEVTPQEVEALRDGTVAIVDVREASEWEQGHLPGAVHISKSYVEQQIEAFTRTQLPARVLRLQPFLAAALFRPA